MRSSARSRLGELEAAFELGSRPREVAVHPREIGPERAVLELDGEECRVIAQALNEVCNGLHLEEFATRMGTEREQVRALLKEFLAVFDKMRSIGRAE